MYFEHAKWPASFTSVDIRDPAEMDKGSLVSSRLPGRNAAHCYILRDPALRHFGTSTLLTRFAMRRAGDLQLSHATDRFGTEVDIIEPGMAAYCIGVVHTGRMALALPGPHPIRGDGWAEAGPGQGPIHSGHAGTHLLTLDGTARTNLWLATARFEAALSASLRERLHTPLIFAPTIDWSTGPAVGLRHLIAYAEAEFAKPDGLATNQSALVAFVDLFVHTALRALPHNYTERLGRSDHPAPVHLRRAEALMESHADEPLRLEDVAAAAGCSVRTLQRAFRQFRATTPHAAIQAARLDRARFELARGTAPVAAVARRFGFTKTSRFAVAYARRFGAPPSGDPGPT